LDTDFLPRPRGLRQFRSNDFRRAGENNRATKSESLQNPEQPFKQVDTAQFGQGVGRIRDQDWQGIVHPLRLTIPLRSANFGDSLAARRLVLAINDPKVILADEPTGNLDTANSERAFELLQNLVHERGKALLLATHNPAIAEACDWIHEMKDGRIIDSQYQTTRS